MPFQVLAEVCSWDLPPLPERYRKACQSLAAGEKCKSCTNAGPLVETADACVYCSADENRRVTRSCEVQDGSSSVSLCGLGLAPSSLCPLLRALKLQASLTELRISGNRLDDNLLPELVGTVITMPRLRILDISDNHITGDGLAKAVNALKGRNDAAFPVNKIKSIIKHTYF